MSWADAHIANLKNGDTVKFRPKGNSMAGKIESGNLVTVEPVSPEDVSVGDIVLCRVSGRAYLHLVKSKDSAGRFQIANARGWINGWTKAIYGKCVKVEP